MLCAIFRFPILRCIAEFLRSIRFHTYDLFNDLISNIGHKVKIAFLSLLLAI